jgi:hypothetical protein
MANMLQLSFHLYILHIAFAMAYALTEVNIRFGLEEIPYNLPVKISSDPTQYVIIEHS